MILLQYRPQSRQIDDKAVSHQETGTLELSDRQQTVGLTGREIIFDHQSITQPGEYETRGIEFIYGHQAALIVWKHLQIVYLFDASKPAQFERTQFTPCDVLIFASSVEKLTKNLFNEILEAYEPKVVAVTSQTVIDASLGEGVTFQEVRSLKLTAESLSQEGYGFYLLRP